jgi:hypothetical protein
MDMRVEIIESQDGTRITTRVRGFKADLFDWARDYESVVVRRLGHFGPFRSEHESSVWPRLAQWLAGLDGLGKAA